LARAGTEGKLNYDALETTLFYHSRLVVLKINSPNGWKIRQKWTR